MKPLMLVASLALMTACLVALAWHRPDPKHEFMFDLVRNLSETHSITTPPMTGYGTTEEGHRGKRLSMVSFAGGLA